jgi:hypothetical protein
MPIKLLPIIAGVVRIAAFIYEKKKELEYIDITPTTVSIEFYEGDPVLLHNIVKLSFSDNEKTINLVDQQSNKYHFSLDKIKNVSFLSETTEGAKNG